MTEPVSWSSDGSPHSPRFSDVYRSRSGAVAQARAVFLGGCGLPEGWRGRDRFTVLETGFGLGLNFLTTWAAWQADAQCCGVLHFVSVEAYPVAAADILRSAQALGQPEAAIPADAGLLGVVELLAQRLSSVWHDLSPGIHHFMFDPGRVQLTLAVGEVQPMLQTLACEADAVYLDGFSPARNPDMWSAATLQAVARHCRAGTRLASYTVAGSVRQALRELGFEVQKCPGLPPKRQRLQAVFAPACPL